MEPHNKIINDTAKKILVPAGMFREGRSRCWLDDNGWFLIQAAFEPSAYGKGSYLAVEISFLWESTADLNPYLGCNYGGRLLVNGAQFAEYRPLLKNCDAIFAAEMEVFAQTALDKVMEYRQFRDLAYAKQALVQKVESTDKNFRFWEVYDLAMLCFFKRDFDEGTAYFRDYMQILKNSFYNGGVYVAWREEFYRECQNKILPQLTSADAAQRMVFDMINRRRSYFNSKKAYQKMKKDVVF